MHKKISIEQSKISDGINFVENGLAELKIAKKQRMKTMLVVEEALVKLTEHAESQDDQIGISLNKNLNRIYVNMTLRGQEFQLIQGYTVEEVLNWENDDQQSSQEEEGMIRDILLRSNKDQLRCKNKNHTNMVEIMVQKNPHAMAIQTMLALAAAIVVGMLMKTFVPDTVNTALNDNIFSSISTMFLNALKMIVGPVVFFSIVSSISQFGDLRRLAGSVVRLWDFICLRLYWLFFPQLVFFMFFSPEIRGLHQS